jgi:hypothetical protein
MIAFQFFQFFLVLIVPGFIGALAFSITARFRTEINIYVALIIDLFTFITMLTGLYFCKHVYTVSDLLVEFNCLHFTICYALLGIWISIVYGVILGFIRRLFFWIRR